MGGVKKIGFKQGIDEKKRVKIKNGQNMWQEEKKEALGKGRRSEKRRDWERGKWEKMWWSDKGAGGIQECEGIMSEQCLL